MHVSSAGITPSLLPSPNSTGRLRPGDISPGDGGAPLEPSDTFVPGRSEFDTGLIPRGANVSGTAYSRASGPSLQQDFLARAWRNLDRWDVNHDGYVSTTEIDRSTRDPRLKGRDAAALAALNQGVRSDQGLRTGFATGNFLSRFTALQSTDFQTPLGPGFTVTSAPEVSRTLGFYRDACERIEARSPQLFNGTPDYRAIEQGTLGDCYFLAFVAGLARKDPAAIQRMIHANSDGTCTVRFPGKSAVTVPMPTVAEIGVQGSAGKNGLWLNVLKKAWEQVRPARTEDRTNGSRYLSDFGGSSKSAIEALTGHYAQDHGVIRPSRAQAQAGLDSKTALQYDRSRIKVIRDALSQGKLVVANTNGDIPDSVQSNLGLVPKHSYTVVACDDKAITLRNPWGQRYPDGKSKGRDDEAVFKLPAWRFFETFEFITVETDRPASWRPPARSPRN